MSHQDYQLKKGIGLVIVGPKASGKIRLALQIAQHYGNFQQIETGVGFDFQMRDALNGQVDVLIIDGDPSMDEMAEIKCMLTSQFMQIRVMNSQHHKQVPTPLVIICTQSAYWLHDGSRRFDVIELGAPQCPTTSRQPTTNATEA